MNSNAAKALQILDHIEHVANQDKPWGGDIETRNRYLDRQLAEAQVYATLAVAEATDQTAAAMYSVAGP